MGNLKCQDSDEVHVTPTLCSYWWAKIRGLAFIGDYEELERFSKQKKSPIGYEVE